jgi:hypothetical protein
MEEQHEGIPLTRSAILRPQQPVRQSGFSREEDTGFKTVQNVLGGERSVHGKHRNQACQGEVDRVRHAGWTHRRTCGEWWSNRPKTQIVPELSADASSGYGAQVGELFAARRR